jgi:hypothetical protein
MCTVTAAPGSWGGSWGGQRLSLAPYFRVTEATSRVTPRRRALMLTTLPESPHPYCIGFYREVFHCKEKESRLQTHAHPPTPHSGA